MSKKNQSRRVKRKVIQKNRERVLQNLKNRRDEKNRYIDRYPQFELRYDPHAPRDLVELVADIFENLNFEDRSLFDSVLREFYRDMKSGGMISAFERRGLGRELRHKMGEDMEGVTRETVETAGSLYFHLGNLFYNMISERNRKRWFPVNDVEVAALRSGDYMVFISSLVSKRTPYGTIYYSPYEPRVELDGHSGIVAFTKHAIDRIVERLIPGSDIDDYVTGAYPSLCAYAAWLMGCGN